MFSRDDHALITAACNNYAKAPRQKFSWHAVRRLILALVIFTNGFATGSVAILLYINGDEVKSDTSNSLTGPPLHGVAITSPILETSNISITTTDLPPSIHQSELAATTTPTSVIYIVYTRAGSGINLRAEPSGKLVQVLPNGTEVILLSEEGVQQNSHFWLHVQTLDGKIDGWVAESLLMRK